MTEGFRTFFRVADLIDLVKNSEGKLTTVYFLSRTDTLPLVDRTIKILTSQRTLYSESNAFDPVRVPGSYYPVG